MSAATFSWADHPALRPQLIDPAGTLEVACPDMHCASCAARIEAALDPLPGVHAVTTNVARRSVRVKLSADVAIAQILDTLGEIGFEARPRGIPADRDAQQRQDRAALKRMGIAGIGMLQVMMYALALYLAEPATISPAIEQLLRGASFVVCTPVVGWCAAPILHRAGRDLVAAVTTANPLLLSMDVPIALALVGAWTASTVNLITGHGPVWFDSVIMFTFFLLTARWIEAGLRHRIADDPDLDGVPGILATRLLGDDLETVPATALVVGDTVLIRNGATLPADGIVVAGSGAVNEAILSGESRPRAVTIGAGVWAGSINEDQPLTVRVRAVGRYSRAGTLAALAAQAASSRGPLVARADLVGRYFVLAILIMATGTALGWGLVDPAMVIPATLAVLVVSCPCALALATPAAQAAALGTLRRAGLAVIRGDFLERLLLIREVAFDKTGTLTSGLPTVTESPLLPPTAFHERIALGLENAVDHPIARAFRQRATQLTIRALTLNSISRLPDGSTGTLDGDRWTLRGDGAGVALYHNDGALPCARWDLAESLEPSAEAAVARLRNLHLRTSILSGDTTGRTAAIGRQLQVDRSTGAASASDKLEQVRQRAHVLLVGDGFNDAPALAGATASIATHGANDLARTRADAVLLRTDLRLVPVAIRTARHMRTIIFQNFGWALTWNLCAIPAAGLGILPAWAAALGMSLSSVLVTLNSARLARAPTLEGQ